MAKAAQYITPSRAFMSAQLPPAGRRRRLLGQQVQGSGVKLMGKPACSPAILWPSGYRAAFLCLCVRVCVSIPGYLLAAHSVLSLSPERLHVLGQFFLFFFSRL